MKNKKSNLKKLQELWDKRLAKAKFQDIEIRKTGKLKSWICHTRKQPFNSETAAWKDSKAQYFRDAGLILHSRIFKDRTEKRIWELHSQGYSANEIAKAVSLTARQIKYAINKIERDSGLKLSRIHNVEATNGSDNDYAHQNNRNSRRRTV